MKRVPIEELNEKEPVVISNEDFKADLQRGFTVIEYAPAGELVISNPRNRQVVHREQVQAVLLFRCMRCQFDVVDSAYAPDPVDHTPRRGRDLIRKHLESGQHPWAYSLFESPYGNVEDVRIEGVTEYNKEMTNE